MIMDMDKRGNGIAWDVENDFLAKYRALMERVKRGDQTAYYQVKELRAKEFRIRMVPGALNLIVPQGMKFFRA